MAWTYDWTTRIDPYGKPTGIFDVTPFPITETSTHYTVQNENWTNTYVLGTLYFVDGAAADDTGDGLTFATPKKTLSAAIALITSTNNATIIIRGAHDAFNGEYIGYGYTSKMGISNTQRVMWASYRMGYGRLRKRNRAP